MVMNSMKHIFWISCLTALSMQYVNAQDSTVALRRPYRAVIKLAPLSLLDQDATVQGGLEYRTGVRTSVQGEFGYGRKGLSLLGSDLKNFASAEVWRGRAEVRFYTNRYRTNRRQGIAIRSTVPLGNYWAIEGLYKQINIVKLGKVYKAEELPATGSSSPGSQQAPVTQYVISSQQIPITRFVVGSHLKIGRQFAFYDPYRHFFSRTLVDIYIGAGVRWAINEVPPPAGINPFPTCGCGIGRSFTRQEGQLTPSLTAGLKIGFAL